MSNELRSLTVPELEDRLIDAIDRLNAVIDDLDTDTAVAWTNDAIYRKARAKAIMEADGELGKRKVSKVTEHLRAAYADGKCEVEMITAHVGTNLLTSRALQAKSLQVEISALQTLLNCKAKQFGNAEVEHQLSEKREYTSVNGKDIPF